MTAVVEWILEAAAQGMIGLMVTAPLIAASERYKALRDQMRNRGAQLLVQTRAGDAPVARRPRKDAPSDLVHFRWIPPR